MLGNLRLLPFNYGILTKTSFRFEHCTNSHKITIEIFFSKIKLGIDLYTTLINKKGVYIIEIPLTYRVFIKI